MTPHHDEPTVDARYVLVLQWPLGSDDDLDDVVVREDILETVLSPRHSYVDGHDIGSGEMNVFVHTVEPFAAFAEVQVALSSTAAWDRLRVAYRPIDGDAYVPLWPRSLKQFVVV